MSPLSEAVEVVTATNLRKQYGRVVALRGLTLRIRRGEIFGLLGPNGAGKSTLMKTLTGVTAPTSGTVRVFGQDPFAERHTVRRQLGYMPQAPALYEDLSARDNVSFFARAHGGADLDARVSETIALVDLQARENDLVYQLSGGMRQRVSLACAMVHRPPLLLLDEPTAGVDPKLREIFWQHFRALAAAGMTIVVSTHQMDDAVLCDRLAVLRSGSVLACEPPRELLRRGRTRVRIGRGGAVEETTLADYAAELPPLLQQHGLDASVTRIEVERDTLESVLLAMIDEHERASHD